MRLIRRTIVAVGLLAFGFGIADAEPINIGIGTQDTTTNTVTAGAVIRELKLLDKYLPKTGKYAAADYHV
jgi:NitT/TauT family transport system substrate-binding protein